MSGVRSGSRLEQLYALQRRIDHEIQHELRKHPGSRKASRRASAPKGPQTVQQRIANLGVTANEIKRWALAQGLISEIRRGRVAAALVDAYATHHATAQENR